MKFQLLGWAPDLDPATPGVFVDCENILPRDDGFGVMPTPSTAVASIAGYPRNMIAVRSGTGLHTVIASYESDGTTATTCTLYEVSGAGAITARAVCTAGTYTVPVIMRHFDGEMFAAKSGSVLRSAAISTDFADVTGAPTASLVEVTKDFVVAFNAGSYDWHCSAIGDAHDWTPDVSTQCAQGVFFNKAGPVVAAGRIGEELAAFTESQTWIGRYVGAPEVWQWEQISRDVGCVGPEAAVETPFGLVWMGRGDIYISNGSAPVPLDTQPVRETIFSTAYRPLLSRAQLAWDTKRQLLWVFAHPVTVQADPTIKPLAFVYRFATKKWGKATINDFRAVNQSSGVDYTYGGTYADDMLAVTGTAGSNTLMRLNNGAGTGSGFIQTGYVGDTEFVTMCRSVRPKFSSKASATTPAILGYAQRYSLTGGTFAYASANMDADYKFQLRLSGRWHSQTIYLNHGDVVSELDVDLQTIGKR